MAAAGTKVIRGFGFRILHRVPYNSGMPEDLLATRFYIPPPRPGTIARPHLLRRLDAGLDAGSHLALFSAPAGSGKSTLASEWIASISSSSRPEPCRCAWLSLDSSDSDPPQFLAYFTAALRTAVPGIGNSVLAALQAPQSPSAEMLIPGLLNELSSLDEKVVLVLDDYHKINAPEVDRALSFLLDNQPHQLHLVIATREDPALPLARLRVRRQLTELRAADLRFTPAESADFLNGVMGLDLTEADVNALENRTEGWIAGLQLAALSMQGKEDTAGFIRSFTGSHRFVLDYLLEEVLSQQPPDVQDFLLQTCILDRLCGPLCDAMLDSRPGSSRQMLAGLERANLFLIPLDNERCWYRYHHLFGDLLRQRISQTHLSGSAGREEEKHVHLSAGPGPDLSVLHLRASAWHEKHSNMAEAFHHALAAREYDLAADLAETAWQGMEGTFQTAAWLGWIENLPEAAVRARPRLSFQAGRAYSDAGNPGTSEVHLQNAERALAETPIPAGFAPLQGSIALTRAYNAQVQGNLAETISCAEQALLLIPASDVMLRAQAAIMLEFTHWSSGDLERALRALDEWMDSMTQLGNHVFVIASAFAAADLQVAMGRLHQAGAALRQAIGLAASHGQEAEAITAHHHLGLALILHEQGRDREADLHLQTAAVLGRGTTLVDWPYRWNLAQARLRESAGEWEEALSLLDEAERVYVKNPVPVTRPTGTLKARIFLRQRRLDLARKWQKEMALSTDGEISYLSEYNHLTLVHLRLAEKSLAGVNNLLERMLNMAESQNRLGSVLEILLTLALSRYAQGSHHAAFDALHRALALAEPQEYLRIFLDEGDPMRVLLSDFQSSTDERFIPLRSCTDRILAAFKGSAARLPEVNFEVLTPRQLEILDMLGQGLSNAEIGQQLFLAVSTVKGHNQRIFDILQVPNRTAAVARARELGLLFSQKPGTGSN